MKKLFDGNIIKVKLLFCCPLVFKLPSILSQSTREDGRKRPIHKSVNNLQMRLVVASHCSSVRPCCRVFSNSKS